MPVPEHLFHSSRLRKYVMINRYKIKYNGTSLATAHVKPHPQYEGQVMVSVIPILKNDVSETLQGTFKLERALYGSFSDTKPEAEAVMELLMDAGMEPGKMEIRQILPNANGITH